MKKDGELIIYRSKDGEVVIATHFKDESIWLSQREIVDLFDTERSVITKHINNIFHSGELEEESNVQKMHIANSDKPVKYYSLDTIISVGYRVNSQKATDFRIWATKTLKQYLVRGYAINEKRLLEQSKLFVEAKKLMEFITNKIDRPELKGHEKEILDVIERYSKTWRVLGEYDEGKIEIKKQKKAKFRLNYYKCREIIESLKNDLTAKKIVGDLFGAERGHQLEGIVGNIYQTYDGSELYDSVEEKAAHFLYFVIKDHPFSDGNKRIGSLLFLYFLEKNNFLFKDNGETKIADRTLVALALLVASSNPKEKDAMIKLVINLIQD